MSSDAWRLHQQAVLVGRLAEEHGLGADADAVTEALAALSALVEQHGALVDEAGVVSAGLDAERSALVDVLDELNRDGESIERALRDAYRIAGELVSVERSAVGELAELLDALQVLREL